MTTTTEEQTTTPEPLFVFDGHLRCDFCGARYDHAIVEGSDLTPRQQARKAASRAGWKQTVADLDACPEDASGVAAILIESWLMIWGPDNPLVPPQIGPPVMNGDDQQTVTIPAVVEPEPAMAAAGPHPYDPSKGSAA